MAEKQQTPPPAPKATLEDLKSSMQAWSDSSVVAAFDEGAKAILVEYGAEPKGFNQAANALAVARALKKADPQFAPKAMGGRYEADAWKKILATLYKGGNASANRQALEAKPPGDLASKLLAENVG